MVHIQEPESPWDVVHMDWITVLLQNGDKGYNASLVIVDRYRKTPIFLPCHKGDTAMDTALLLLSRVITHTGLFKNIMSDRDPKFSSALWTNLHKLFGTKVSFFTAYHPQTDGLAERMIQTSEDMIRRFSDTLRKDLIKIHPTASSFKIILDKVKHHENQSITDTFDYAKQKWDKSHKVTDFKVGDLVLVSTLNFNNIKGPKKLKYSCLGPFVIVELHGANAIQVELSGELENKHPTFPVSLIKCYKQTEKELFHLRNPTPFTVPPVEQSEDKKIKKVIKERILRCKNKREYLVRYRNPPQEYEWLAESEIPDPDKLLRMFRHERRPQA
ncbi:hypothetical protein O181_042325 [Austropuccinia psidii MF-1]|uniref:Integrase catalytic domain-containing protein n=1 Tax=Austropuccinia psidii MF-1 TaxID=1389203 RepID=A0A9Q3DKF9_9BASI|nr:hypothetical protein [Austropuccinia psidii MF-1]